MKRRKFLAVLAGTALSPLAAHAQQVMPVIGFVALPRCSVCALIFYTAN
jgi:hypothetical protein